MEKGSKLRVQATTDNCESFEGRSHKERIEHALSAIHEGSQCRSEERSDALIWV